jgi:anti-anti-sigma regulatory factor
MIYDYRPFLAFWRESQAHFVADLCERVLGALPHYRALPREQLVGSIERKIDLWHQLLISGEIAPILERTRALVQHRVGDQFPLVEMVHTGDLFRDCLVQTLHRYWVERHLPAIAAVLEEIEAWSREDRDVVLRAYDDELKRIWGTLAMRIQAIEEQQLLIDTLSAPLVPIDDHTLLLPLVGPVDQTRLGRVTATVLEHIAAVHADALILDVTGVPSMEVAVAHELVQLARATRLLGAQLILVGIRPQIALALAQTPIGQHTLLIQANLQAAIRYAARHFRPAAVAQR